MYLLGLHDFKATECKEFTLIPTYFCVSFCYDFLITKHICSLFNDFSKCSRV